MKRAPASRPCKQTLRGLDATNFIMADTVTGVGPFLAIYLAASLHWDPAEVGIAMSAGGIAAIVAQTPVGALVDRLRYKREAIPVGAALVGVGCLAAVFFHQFAASFLCRSCWESSARFSHRRWRE